ncbi:hypothetical protein OAV67_01070 [Alphaproteobacteria bacterium]|nr:hypothetical protein [Alphaproteobacteria bacterium]
MGMLACFGVWRSRQTFAQDSLYMGVALLFLSPLIFLALVVNEPLWDDFTHWLVSAQYLIREGHLPTADSPVLNHSHQSYPYARALLHAWVDRTLGDFNITVQGVFNIFFGSTLLLWVPLWMSFSLGRRASFYECLIGMGCFSWVIIIWAALLGSTLIVSSYADPVYSIAMVHLFFALALDAFRRGSFSQATSSLDPVLICLFVSPIILKQSGLYFSLMMLGMFWLYSTIEYIKDKGSIRIMVLAQRTIIQALYLLPMFCLNFIWSFYCRDQNVSGSFSLKAAEFWNFDVLHHILGGIGVQIASRPYTSLGALIIVGILILWMKRGRPSQDRVFILLPLSLCFLLLTTLFQLLAYCFVFTEYEAIRGASFNRYIAPSGLIIWSSLFVCFIKALTSKPLMRQQLISGGLALSFFAVIISFSHKIVPMPRLNPSLVGTAEMIKNSYHRDKTLMMLDLLGNGIEPTVIRFYLDQHMYAAYTPAQATQEKITPEILAKWVKGYDHVYVHSAPDYVLPMVGAPIEIVMLGRSLRERYPRGERLLLLDLIGSGKDGNILSLMLERHMNITLLTRSDLKIQMTEDEIIGWLEGHQHLYIHTAPEHIRQLFEKNLTQVR